MRKNYIIDRIKQELNSSKLELDNSKAEVIKVLSKYDITYDEVLNRINKIINTFGSKEKAIEELTNLAKMYNVDATIVQKITEAVDGILKIEEGKKELDIQKQKLNTAKETYNSGLLQYNSGYSKYEKRI